VKDVAGAMKKIEDRGWEIKAGAGGPGKASVAADPSSAFFM